jgi:hypothetical protein
MTRYSIGIIVGAAFLSLVKKGSKSIQEKDFDIEPLDPGKLDAAKSAHQSRVKNLPTKTVQPTGKYTGPKRTKIGFILNDWRNLNPKIKYVSDLLFVEKLDPVGQQILNTWLNMPDNPSAFWDLQYTKDKVWENKIEDYNTHWNMKITEISELTDKKPNITIKQKATAPIGDIAFYQTYGVPYKLKPININPTLIWNGHHNDQS